MPSALVVPLARLVPLRFNAVGQARAASLLGCPTVPPAIPSRPCERSAQHHAQVARTRVIQFLSLHEKEDKKVGQWGEAPNLGALRRPTSVQEGGTYGTAQQQSKPYGGVVPVLFLHRTCVMPILFGGIKSRLLPPESTCKK